MVSRTNKVTRTFCALLLCILCSACGLYVPEKDPLSEDRAPPPPHTKLVSERGTYEATLIDHIQCEIALGLLAANDRFKLEWLYKWGTAITLTVSAQEQSGVNPSLSFTSPLENTVNTFARGGNVNLQQSLSTSVGAGASASTLRSETIQFTYRNSDIFRRYDKNTDCNTYRTGVQIDSDLKIRQFIFDKAAIANNGTANLAQPSGHNWALFNTFTEELSFNSAYSISANPVLKLSTLAVDPTGTLIGAARSYNNDLIITIGQLSTRTPGPFSPVELAAAGQAQHNSKVVANAISTSIKQP